MTTGRSGHRAVPTREDAFALLAGAVEPGDVFPDDPAAAAQRYRALAQLICPDIAPANRGGAARTAFTTLDSLWKRHNASPARPTITTRKGSYLLGGTFTTGDLAVLRNAVAQHTEESVLIKIPRRHADNDLMAREARALTRLATEGAHKFRVYAPRLLDTFRYRAATAMRRVNVLEALQDWYTLAEVRHAYPDGVDPRDVGWMWRRLLVALGWAHHAGVIHAAVLPEHVLIHPAKHGLVLVDWCYAVVNEPDGTVPALIERHRDWYPPEVLRRQPATQATDIHMASLCMSHLMGGRAPRELRAFVQGCTLAAQASRPHDAWRLLTELDEVLERLYGSRAFREFTMPG